MIKEILEKLIRKEDLTCEEAREVMVKIMKAELTDAQVAAYLIALRCKGESVNEIRGSCAAIRGHSLKINVLTTPLVDTCGTGGDGKGTFNISTVSAFVSAGAGVTVAKHGNRAVSGKCGSSDLCDALGINLELSPSELEQCLKETGLAFLYAPLMHPAMASAVPARKALGLRTIFNMLGPLNNPAGVKRQLIGVYEAGLTEKMGAVLHSLGLEHAMVVAGADGLDEITLTTETRVTELKNGKLSNYVIAPEDYGFARVSLRSLQGGDTVENSRSCLAILKGEKGPKRDVVMLNAGAAIYVSGLAQSINEGVELAKTAVDSGAAYAKLKAVVNYSKMRQKIMLGNEGGRAHA